MKLFLAMRFLRYCPFTDYLLANPIVPFLKAGSFRLLTIVLLFSPTFFLFLLSCLP